MLILRSIYIQLAVNKKKLNHAVLGAWERKTQKIMFQKLQ